jgi:hypothetical protein
MRQYSRTNTGHYLTLIQGGGQGDGVPRGRLTLVTDQNVSHFETMQNDNIKEESQFETATVTVLRPSYIGADLIELRLRMPLDAKHLKKHGLGGHVVDVSNYIYRRFGVGVSNPSVSGLKDRASRGLKMVTFCYEISQIEAAKLGFRDEYGECLILKRVG